MVVVTPVKMVIISTVTATITINSTAMSAIITITIAVVSKSMRCFSSIVYNACKLRLWRIMRMEVLM